MGKKPTKEIEKGRLKERSGKALKLPMDYKNVLIHVNVTGACNRCSLISLESNGNMFEASG
jgi:hypothetical protein